MRDHIFYSLKPGVWYYTVVEPMLLPLGPYEIPDKIQNRIFVTLRDMADVASPDLILHVSQLSSMENRRWLKKIHAKKKFGKGGSKNAKGYINE